MYIENLYIYKYSNSLSDITSTSTTTGIVMMAVVGCVVITSLVWVVIIYQTRKRPQAGSLGPPPAYPREDVLGRYPAHLPTHHHLPSDLVHTFTPLLANSHETYTTAGQDSGSEHSSGKDSGTGDSAQRSNEDLLPLDLSRPGLRRSLIICADNGSASVLRGKFFDATINVMLICSNFTQFCNFQGALEISLS